METKEKAGNGWKLAAFIMGIIIIFLLVVILGFVIKGSRPSQTMAQDSTGVRTSSTGSGETEGDGGKSEAVTLTGKKSNAVKTDNTGKTGGSEGTVKTGQKKKKKKKYVLTYSGDNSWNEGGITMRTLDLAVKNKRKASVKDWKLVIKIDGLKSVSGWNGDYTVKGKKIIITPADYNSEIYAKGTIYLGCNLGTDGNFKIKSAKLNGKKCKIKNGTVDQNAINQGNGSGSSGSGDNGNSGNSGNNNPGNNGNTDNNGNPGNNNNSGNNGNSGNDGNTGNNSNSGNNGNSGNSGSDVSAVLKRSKDAVQGDDWLHTDGHRILDKNGKEVWLTGVNWFGYNTGTNTFDGLWNSELDSTVKAIADHGFNLIRVPISAELINQWAAGTYPQANYNQAYNSSLNGLNSLEIFDHFLTMAEACGIKVMMDIHSAETDASGHMTNLWYTDKVSLSKYYSALEWMAARYKNNDTIIAYDLKNEPHGKPNEGDKAAIWNDSKKNNNWKYIAETAAAKVLAKNPNVLIMVEGTEIYPKKKGGNYSSTSSADYYFTWWGGNLRGVKEYPVNLGKYQNKLVYSPHDYGPTVYEQPWFKSGYNYDSLMKDCWRDNWFFIYEDNTAPLLIGEWGGFMKEPNLTWMTCMRTLILKYHLHHTFWCLNANSGDTGGLLLDDFVTWDTEKYNFVKKVLWQENGKFVGLDHEIPLGDKGISLGKAKGL